MIIDARQKHMYMLIIRHFNKHFVHNNNPHRIQTMKVHQHNKILFNFILIFLNSSQMITTYSNSSSMASTTNFTILNTIQPMCSINTAYYNNNNTLSLRHPPSIIIHRYHRCQTVTHFNHFDTANQHDLYFFIYDIGNYITKV